MNTTKHEETPYQYFTKAGFERVHSLMNEIGQMTPGKGGIDPRNEFLKLIQQPADGVLVNKPWLSSTVDRIAAQIFGKETIDEERLSEAIQDTLLQIIAQDSVIHTGTVMGKKSFVPHQNPIYFMGNEHSWSNFSKNFQNALRHKLKAVHEEIQQEPHAKTLLTGSVAALDTPPDPQETCLAHERVGQLNQALAVLKPRAVDVLLSRSEGSTLEEIAVRHGIFRAHVFDIEKRAHGKLRKILGGIGDPSHPPGSGRGIK